MRNFLLQSIYTYFLCLHFSSSCTESTSCLDERPVGFEPTCDILEGDNFTLALKEVAYHSAVDDSTKLLFVGATRVKYRWGATDYLLVPTHTFNTGRWQSPITTLAGGHFIRAGKGSPGIWNIDSQPIHGTGMKTIGGNEDGEDLETGRDDPE